MRQITSSHLTNDSSTRVTANGRVLVKEIREITIIDQYLQFSNFLNRLAEQNGQCRCGKHKDSKWTYKQILKYEIINIINIFNSKMSSLF